MFFVFNANTRGDSKNPENVKNRWGFKCRITPLVPTDSYESLIDQWSLDLENVLATVGGKYAATLIEGEPLSEKERKCNPWLEAKLLNGGLEENDGNPEHNKFLESFIEKTPDVAAFCNWMEKQTKRQMLSIHSKKPLETAERYVMAAMMKQLYMVDEARTFADILQNGDITSVPEDAVNKEKFAMIAQESGKITTGLQQKGQLEKEWNIAVEEKQTFDTFSNAWREEKKEKLAEMCEMKEVEFDSRDDKATIKALFDQLQEDIAKRQQGAPGIVKYLGPYDTVAQPVIERAKLLLK